MHWLIPFAGAQSPAAQAAIDSLALPHLERLLARLTLTATDEGDALSLSPPHERALAHAWGWTPQPDGLLPLAAAWAAADGLAVSQSTAGPPQVPHPPSGAGSAQPEPEGYADDLGWGLLSPTHWHVGTDQVSLTHPDDLALDEATSRAAFDAVRALFDDEGLPLQWGAPTRWYIAHPRLATLPSASLDRVVGRNVDLWLNTHADARLFRRLQAEVQMLLYTHPINDAREAHGLLPVNSFWLSGTGRPQAISPAARVNTDERLRSPALADDWTAWAEAWAALDAGPMAGLLAAAEAGQPVTLTLCGESRAQRFETQPRSLTQRLFGSKRQAAGPVLKGL